MLGSFFFHRKLQKANLTEKGVGKKKKHCRFIIIVIFSMSHSDDSSRIVTDHFRLCTIAESEHR